MLNTDDFSENSKHISRRRAERVRRHVSSHWLPCNPELLDRIEAGLEDGHYDLDIDFLLSEIKTDIGLFTYCLRRVIEELRDLGVDPSKFSNPFDLFREAGLERIKTILTYERDKISSHDMLKMNRVQYDRLSEAVVATSSVEVMIENTELEEELGYTVSVLRQLGLMLVAWNYPGLFERALDASNLDESVESIIARELGISPVMLVMKIIKGWGFSSDVMTAVSGAGDDETDALELQKLCEAGEALARANNPERYPTAPADWEMARTQLEAMLGPGALRDVQKKIKENSTHLTALLPDYFSESLELKPAEKLFKLLEDQKLTRNPYVMQCPFILRNKLKELYANLEDGPVDHEQVSFLIKQVIPLAGFQGGVVYIVDPASMQLIPRISFGSVEMRDRSVLDVSDEAINNHPVQDAFSDGGIISDNMASTMVSSFHYIAGVVGSSKRAGVLYVEYPVESMSMVDSSMKVHFQAILGAINDVLKL